MRRGGVGIQAARLAAALLAAAAAAAAHGVVAGGWLTGSELAEQLRQPVNITWSGNPLREALRGLSRSQRVAVLIDRRVDPGQKLQVQIERAPLGTALKQIAEDRGLGVTYLGSVVYFGPTRVASRLRTVAAQRVEQIRQLASSVRRKFLQAEPMAWGDFSMPRNLLADLAEQSRVEIAGLRRVPHDLWAAADLPALSLVDRLTLIAVQFDLTFEVSDGGKTITLVSLPEDVSLLRSYPGGRQPDATAKRFAALAPHAQIRVAGQRVYVKGLLEDHERLTSPRQPEGRSKPQPTQAIERTRIERLSVEAIPVGRLLEALATQLDLQLEIDRRALRQSGISLEQRVSVHLENTTIDAAFSEALRSTGLTFRRQGRVVRIAPAD